MTWNSSLKKTFVREILPAIEAGPGGRGETGYWQTEVDTSERICVGTLCTWIMNLYNWWWYNKNGLKFKKKKNICLIIHLDICGFLRIINTSPIFLTETYLLVVLKMYVQSNFRSVMENSYNIESLYLDKLDFCLSTFRITGPGDRAGVQWLNGKINVLADCES